MRLATTHGAHPRHAHPLTDPVDPAEERDRPLATMVADLAGYTRSCGTHDYDAARAGSRCDVAQQSVGESPDRIRGTDNEHRVHRLARRGADGAASCAEQQRYRDAEHESRRKCEEHESAGQIVHG